jgi:threonylcarbamoyladenosine tRNA methylthiotransferase MtaB
MPHLHLSLQSGDNLILKRMKRRHTREDSIRFCEDVRKVRPEVVFGADIIAGFPTETEEMFKNSLAIVSQCALTNLHVFPFSPRNGTPAAKMPQLDRGLVKERAARLRAAGQAAYLGHLEAMRGTQQSVLVEKPGLGRTEGFTLTELEGGRAGDILPVRITGHTDGRLTGVLASRQAA